eukprot:8471645-Pyramimonas_sp.AAC.1
MDKRPPACMNSTRSWSMRARLSSVHGHCDPGCVHALPLDWFGWPVVPPRPKSGCNRQEWDGTMLAVTAPPLLHNT